MLQRLGHCLRRIFNNGSWLQAMGFAFIERFTWPPLSLNDMEFLEIDLA